MPIIRFQLLSVKKFWFFSQINKMCFYWFGEDEQDFDKLEIVFKKISVILILISNRVVYSFFLRIKYKYLNTFNHKYLYL